LDFDQLGLYHLDLKEEYQNKTVGQYSTLSFLGESL